MKSAEGLLVKANETHSSHVVGLPQFCIRKCFLGYGSLVLGCFQNLGVNEKWNGNWTGTEILLMY